MFTFLYNYEPNVRAKLYVCVIYHTLLRFNIFINNIMKFFFLKGGCHDSDNFCLSGSLLTI